MSVFDLFSKFDVNKLKSNLGPLSDFLSSKEGEEIREKLKNIDKDKLMEMMNSMDKSTSDDNPQKLDEMQNLSSKICQNPELLQKLKKMISDFEKK